MGDGKIAVSHYFRGTCLGTYDRWERLADDIVADIAESGRAGLEMAWVKAVDVEGTARIFSRVFESFPDTHHGRLDCGLIEPAPVPAIHFANVRSHELAASIDEAWVAAKAGSAE